MVLFRPNKKVAKLSQCREGLHALPKTMFDLFLKAVGAFVSGWFIFFRKGIKPSPTGFSKPIFEDVYS
jgi:hypothetical protein